MHSLRKYRFPGEISPFMKIHGTHVPACSGPGIHGSGTSPTKVERTSVKLSNSTGTIENGRTHIAHEASESEVSKIVYFTAFNRTHAPDIHGFGTTPLCEKSTAVYALNDASYGSCALRVGAYEPYDQSLILCVKIDRYHTKCFADDQTRRRVQTSVTQDKPFHLRGQSRW